MDANEKNKFIVLAKETAAISGTEEVDLLEEALIGLFDGNSETFNDLEATQIQLEENYAEVLEGEKIDFVSTVKNVLFGADTVYEQKRKRKSCCWYICYGGSL
ncbi:hypothetical protein MKX83_03020 [Cytobacillus sp. FSL M8-0252]|uniref:hypothetical protein n=1 Tax=Cytobacillus sp. FSL M8-0252 TaxID=2921621 RepID=UPI0030FAB67D